MYKKQNVNYPLKFLIKSIVIVTIGLMLSCSKEHAKLEKPAAPQGEVFYHIFLRSFYDSNGDAHGDLSGLHEKLDYLQQLGITSILITPLYHSDFYHNYFPIDFEEIDPEFGTKEDYFTLLNDIHHRGMKLYMDMEIHYVTEDHIWYKDSYQNPASKYSKYIIYNGPDNTDPEPMIFNLTELQSFDGKIIKCCTVDLYNQNVRDYHYSLFKYWVDPNKDGNFDDGIDGFRIDHIMDDLDWKGKITGLLRNFWKPLFQQLRKINPDILIIGEQADWGYGTDYFNKGDLDFIFAFPLSKAIRTFNANDIQNKIDSTYLATPKEKYQLIFIENHDMPRIATALNGGTDEMKIGAALNILIKGVPIIYYGQEIGMQGANGLGKYGLTDGNDIPVREAFEWYKTIDGPGMALWHKDSGPWWDETNLNDNDGISLEEQRDNPHSLWNFYKNLLSLRKANNCIKTGNFSFVKNDNENVISFLRWDENQSVLVALNLSNEKEQIRIAMASLPITLQQDKIQNIFYLENAKELSLLAPKFFFTLDAHDIQVWQVR